MHLFGKPKYLIRIIYKSGHRIVFWCYEFDVKHKSGAITEVNWEAVDPKNRPLLIGVNDIESVWVVDSSTPIFSRSSS